MIPFDDYFWLLKRTFPGDPDFFWGNYADLPYVYVLSAVREAQRLQRREAHLAERPIAQLSSIVYNINRGKKTKPLRVSELFQYAAPEDLDLPEGRFGRSLERAISERVYPSWALFIYKEVIKGASGECPEVYIAQCQDVCVLAPEVNGMVLKGLIIAQESASEKVRQLVTPDGTIYVVKIPKIGTKLVAEEEWELPLVSIQKPV